MLNQSSTTTSPTEQLIVHSCKKKSQTMVAISKTDHTLYNIGLTCPSIHIMPKDSYGWFLI